MPIPFLDLKAQYRNIKDEIDEKIAEVVASQRFILGEEVEKLEEEIAAYSGARHGVGVSSGSDALIISLMALGIGEGDHVVTTPFTFFATAGAVARLRAVPIFCDIEPDGFNLDPVKLEELLKQKITGRDNGRIKAIIPVHLYGQLVDMDAINALAKLHNLFVVEDAAQAVGSEYAGVQGIKRACTLGDMGTLSFFPSKNLGAFGDGGMVLTDDTQLAEKLRVLRVHGSQNKYIYQVLGGNFRLDALQAAILRIKLNHLDDWHLGRQRVADGYRSRFQDSGLLDSGAVRLPVELYRDQGIKHYHTYHQYVLRVQDRDRLQIHLRDKGIPSAIYYPLGLHLQECFSYLGYKKGDFPQTEMACQEVLALPVYPELTETQQDQIVEGIRSFYS
ncbi:MAG: DegT/DnrJ/EryC1/StrS family aminotransferase [Candidatus Aminicenantaceae bacterium]